MPRARGVEAERVIGALLGLTLIASHPAASRAQTIAPTPNAPAPNAPFTITRTASDITIAPSASGPVRVVPIAGGDASSARPRLRVEAPATTPLTVSVEQGDVRVESFEGDLAVKVVRGSIRAAGLRGRVRLEVDTGPIVASGVRLTDGHSLKCRTFNGDVTITLAAPPTDARILALTLNGAVESSVPLTTRAAFGPRFGEATIGAGTHVLNIDVVRGNILIAAK